VTRLLEQHSPGMAARWLTEWQRILDGGVDVVAEVLTSPSPLAVELRQNSPFAGALPPETRSRVLAAFAKHWRAEHANGHRQQTSARTTATMPPADT
jgi:hypothetical protein